MRARAFVGYVLALIAIGAIAASGASAATFAFTDSEQTFAVPAGVTGVHVVAVGARGFSVSGIGTNPGGFGAMLSADVPVPPGTSTLYVEVGGVGSHAASAPWAGGFDGGGGGPFGGGGASDIRTVSCGLGCATGGSSGSLASRLAVAGGGGAASDVADGGKAGNADGSGAAGASVLSGSGATTSAAGSGATTTDTTNYCQSEGDTNGEPGELGALGLGGDGFTFLIEGTPDSSGGGGGLYGGGGGGQCYSPPGTTATIYAGAGGGGSSGARAGSSVSVTTDSTDPAEVIITAPVPTVSLAPTLSGGLAVGEVLSEAHATWSSSVPLTGYSYQWELCNSTGALGTCAPISGATAPTYTLRAADLGGTLRVQETARNFYGTSAASTSDPTGLISGSATPTISGNPIGIIEATMTWTFAASEHAVTIRQLTVDRAPVGASIIVICTGHGCPRARTIAVVAPRCRSTKKKKQKCGKPPSTVNVALAGRFHKRHLARSARLTVRIVKPRYIGKVYLFSMRHPGAPVVSCLAPGSTTPGKTC